MKIRFLLMIIVVLGILSLTIRPEKSGPIFKQVAMVNVKGKSGSSYILSNEKIPGIREKVSFEGYDIVSKLSEENITLYAKKLNEGYYQYFKIDFKGEIYTRPFWMNVTNPTYAPQIIYDDINKDTKKELIIILNKGYGTGVLDEEVYVYEYTNGLGEVLVDDPLAIINKNVRTKLTSEKAEIILGDKVSIVDTKSIEPSHLFENIGFGSIIDYEVINNDLMVRLSGQITPAMFVGDIIITYEYRDKMYQAKSIEFITDINKNPFYGPVKH